MNPPDSFKRQLGPGGLEMRAIPADSSQIAAAEQDGAPVIYGYGAVYNVVTTIGDEEYGFDEMFAPAAFRQSVAEGDWRSMFNHDTNELLGRTKNGTLILQDDEVGVAYRVLVNPDDPNAMSTHAKVARGDVDGSSVWFRCIEDLWTYPDATNGLKRPLRVVVAAAGIETGPVTFPAYEASESAARSLAPLDVALRAAGVKDHGRASIAADLLTDPDAAQEALRRLFAKVPDLREQVCACETPGPAATAAPAAERAATAAQEPETRLSDLEAAKRRLRLLEVSAPA